MNVVQVIYLTEAEGCLPFSGAENHLIELLNIQSTFQHPLYFVVFIGEAGPNIDKLITDLRVRGIYVYPVVRPQLLNTRFFCKMLILRKILSLLILSYKFLAFLPSLKGPAVFHLHLDFFLPAIIIRLFSSAKIVVSFHNDEPAYKTLVWRVKLFLTSVLASHGIGITDHVSNWVRKCGFRCAPIKTIYYGISDFERISCLPPRFSPIQSPSVLFIGRFVEQKDIPLLLHAAKLTPNVNYYLIGSGKIEFDIRRLCNSLSLANVNFLGSLDRASSYIHLFDLFCLPSLWEGLGLVLVESMFSEVPIVAMASGAIPEVLEHGQFGHLVFERDPTNLACAINYVLDNYVFFKEQSSDIRMRALSKYDPTRMARETQQIYEIAITS